MALMAGVRESSTGFEEEKRLAALDQPVRSSGTLTWQAPDRMTKRTSAPLREDLVVVGRRLTLDRPAENVHQVIDLDQVPEVASLVEAIRGTLAGDLAALRAHYSVGLEGDEAAWRLTLVPTGARVRELVKVVRIDGSGAAIRSVETIEPKGDLTRMVMEPAAG